MWIIACFRSCFQHVGCSRHVPKVVAATCRRPLVENDASVAQCVPTVQSNSWSYNFSRKIKNNMKENHSSRWIKHPILVSKIIIFKNHGSRRLPKSRFMRNRKVISQLTGNKTSNSRFAKIPFTTLFNKSLEEERLDRSKYREYSSRFVLCCFIGLC